MNNIFENKKIQFRTECLNKLCLCCLQLLYVVWIVLIEWSLHTHSEHWQHFESVFLFLAVVQIGLTCVQNGPELEKKRFGTVKEQYTICIMIILCQGDFREQIEKLVRLLHCTTENCWGKDQVWVHFFYPFSNPRANKISVFIVWDVSFMEHNCWRLKSYGC
jgi:hypothetical protein